MTFFIIGRTFYCARYVLRSVGDDDLRKEVTSDVDLLLCRFCYLQRLPPFSPKAGGKNVMALCGVLFTWMAFNDYWDIYVSDSTD